MLLINGGVKLHDGHRDRLRKKFVLGGIDGWPHHEVLELLLFYAIARRNTNDIAHRLIEKFGSFNGVFEAPLAVLKDVDGIGESTAIFLKLISAVARIYAESRNSCNDSTSLENLYNSIALKFIGRTEEVVVLTLLDAKSKVLFSDVINKGSVNSVDLYVRKIIDLVAMYNASSVVLAHNHPSGVAVPSKEDLISTEHIKNLLRNMHVNLLDHLIIADKDYISIRESLMAFDEELED